MARVLYDGLVEYEDGTAATTSQMAKDVVEFLNWAAEPEMDERKRMGWKVMAIGSVLFAMSVWVKRYVFNGYECQSAMDYADNMQQVQVVHHQDQTPPVQPSCHPRQDEPPPVSDIKSFIEICRRKDASCTFRPRAGGMLDWRKSRNSGGNTGLARFLRTHAWTKDFDLENWRCNCERLTD